jgi:hypothetical protein
MMVTLLGYKAEIQNFSRASKVPRRWDYLFDFGLEYIFDTLVR